MSARMVLLGPPGAGKGTQAARIAERLGIPAISTGDIFRANVAGATELGTQAKAYMDKGEYVPDSITNAMVADRIAQADCKTGFLLDGYPRTTAQVGELDSMLKGSGLALDAVVEITADAEAVVARLLKRAGEQGRADDTEPVIRRRLEVYAESTAPLAGIYAERGLLVQVDGMGEIDAVTGRIMEALAARGIMRTARLRMFRPVPAPVGTLEGTPRQSSSRPRDHRRQRALTRADPDQDPAAGPPHASGRARRRRHPRRPARGGARRDHHRRARRRLCRGH